MEKRILSIDGGGIKGVFPASFLASIEEYIGAPVAGYFDLIAGTSTGGIVALGLGLGLSAKDMLGFYEKHGSDIFGGNRILRFLRQLGRAKYDQVTLKRALEAVFGQRLLGESRARLVIPSFDLDTGKVYVYKTAHHPRFQTDYKELVVNVALATSAAPTYFPVHRTTSGIPLTDGGLWANNPVGVSAVEAIGVLGWPREAIKILSIGCTSEAFNVSGNGGRLAWAPKIADVFLASQSSAALGTAQLLIGHGNLTRINPVVPTGRFGLDTVREIDSLRGLGVTEARTAYPNLATFFSKQAEPFNPEYHISQ